MDVKPIETLSTSSLAVVVAATAVVAAAVVLTLYPSRRSPASLSIPAPHGSPSSMRSRDDEEPEDARAETAPDEFRDPITLGLVEEPCILCATGQVYCLNSLREWISNGSRICPKTNIEVLDVQVTKLPWLKQRIREWKKANGVQVVSSEEEALEEKRVQDRLGQINAGLPGIILDIRSDTGHKRVQAITELFKLLRLRESVDLNANPDYERDHRYIRDHIQELMLWLLRYGEPYTQGVAASILAFSDTTEEVAWLAATAAVPAILVCQSSNRYASQAATSLVYNIARSSDIARRTLKSHGAMHTLVGIVATPRSEYGYSRSRASAALAEMAQDPEVRSYLSSHAVESLASILLESTDRWEQRDAAAALIRLDLSQEELQLRGLVSKEKLWDYQFCSKKWLEGLVDSPGDGSTVEEFRARQELADWVRENEGEGA